MSGRKVPIPPVYKRLLSLRWHRSNLDDKFIETPNQWKNSKHGNIFRQKQELFSDRNNGGLTEEQINFLAFRAGKENTEGIFSGTDDGVYFPDIEPSVEHFMEDIQQIRSMLARDYRSYEVDTACVWKVLYYAELLLKGYTLQRLVSKGEFGYIYSATCYGTNCKISVAEEIAKDGATKVGVKITDKSETHWYQVRNEIAAHALTSGHPNVLKLYQVFHTATAIYLVQEFPEKGSLGSLVPRNGFTEQECCDIMKGILEGLRHLQRLDVVHRNLTCTNILLTSLGTVKIAEFGLACVLPHRDFPLHQKVGTPGYMAPEILRGHEYNGFLSDIWSIGILLYFLLHKFLPFTDEHLSVYSCWHCLDFTRRSLSVELCLFLRSILQFRPTARPSVETILRHDWLTQNAKPRIKSQMKGGPPFRPSTQPEPLMNGGLTNAHHSSSVQSVQEKDLLLLLKNQRRDSSPCWANLMCSNGRNTERISLTSRLISHSQQEKINRLERKLNVRNRNKRISTKSPAVLPEIGIIHPKKKKPQPIAVDKVRDAPTSVPPTQEPSSAMPLAVNETPLGVAPPEPDSGDGRRGKEVYCTSLRCFRQIQQERVLFDTTPSMSHRSSLTIHVQSVSEDDKDNYDGDEEKKASEKEGKASRLDEETSRERDSERTEENGDNVTKIDEDADEMTDSSGEKSTLTIGEDITLSHGMLSDEGQISLNGKNSLPSFHQVKEWDSEKRLIASIRSLRNSAAHIESINSIRSSLHHGNDDSEAVRSWVRHSGFGIYVTRASLDALDEVPAEYAAGLDVEDVEIERLIKTQYYNQLDLPSMADDPLEAETYYAALLRHGSRSETGTVETRCSSVVSMTDEDLQVECHEGTPPAPILVLDTLENWVRAIQSGSLVSDNSSASSLFHPELAINWDLIESHVVGSDGTDVAPMKEIKTRSRTIVVSKAPSLRAIAEERQGRGGGLGGSGVGVEVGRIPENTQTQDSLGKRTSEGFTSKMKSKDQLLSSSSSSVGRLQTQSQIQIQEERSESACWESISPRGIARGSYPKLAASVACETSLHSIVELNTEMFVEQLEQDEL